MLQNQCLDPDPNFWAKNSFWKSSYKIFKDPDPDINRPDQKNCSKCYRCCMSLLLTVTKVFFLDHGLDFAELLTAGSYKEEHRSAMLSWSEKIRQDTGSPSHF
jgi:hypothetical protein